MYIERILKISKALELEPYTQKETRKILGLE